MSKLFTFFKLTSCYNVDGEYRIYTYLKVLCYTSSYDLFANGVALPGIIVWGLGIPFFALALLSQVRHKLKNIEVKEKFGFLYRGYKNEFYYWESVIMYRKIILIIVQVFISKYGVISQVSSHLSMTLVGFDCLYDAHFLPSDQF